MNHSFSEGLMGFLKEKEREKKIVSIKEALFLSPSPLPPPLTSRFPADF